MSPKRRSQHGRRPPDGKPLDCETHSPQELRAQEQEWMKKYGWYMHYVPGDSDVPQGFVNAHTHGLEESWGHYDLQVVIPLDQRTVNGVLQSAVDLVKAGTKIVPGEDYEKIIKNYKVRFAWAKESDRRVLRMILPDAQGRISPHTMEPTWARQWEGTEE